MSLALVHSRARAGVHAPPVRVEVHLSGGLPSTQIVGLPEAAVRESRDRVRAAILCAQFEFPARRITINLAPADLPKDGARFDLPIALGILAASGQIDREALAGHEFIGELALTGELRGVDGALPAALAAAAEGRTLVVPHCSGGEAALAQQATVLGARTLLEVCGALNGTRPLPAAEAPPTTIAPLPDLADVRGQAQARRALEIAAAGSHHLLLLGSPAAARPCWPRACPASCPRPARPRRWRPPPLPRSAGVAWIRRAGGSGPIARRTTPPAPWPWWAAARTRARARSRWHTTACCSSTNSRNGTDTRWKCCANRWNRAWSPSRGRPAVPSFPRASSSWPR
jgi:Predicted ATPase with chaperone activity